MTQQDTAAHYARRIHATGACRVEVGATVLNGNAGASPQAPAPVGGMTNAEFAAWMARLARVRQLNGALGVTVTWRRGESPVAY